MIPADLSEFNVTDLGTTVNFVNSVRPDAIVHSAAFTDVDACEKREKAFAVNALGARNVAVAARKYVVPLLEKVGTERSRARGTKEGERIQNGRSERVYPEEKSMFLV